MALFQKSVVNKYLKTLDSVEIDKSFLKFKEFYGNSARLENIRLLKEENYQEGFLREIFVQVLGYTINPDENYNLTTEFKNLTDAKKADGAILDDGKAIGVIELKSTKTTLLESITEQAFNYKNHQPNCRYIITSNFEKIRFYIDNATDFEEFNLFTLTEDDFKILFLILSKESIFNEIPLKLKKESVLHEENISKQLYQDYSTFKRKIFENLVQNNLQFDQLTLFKKSQKLLDRFLFVLFGEDSGLVPPNAVSKIIDQWKAFTELDEPVSLYSRFIKLFHHLDIGHKYKTFEIPAYNGGLFSEDEILNSVQIDDEVLLDDSLKLSTYDFQTDIDVNILGHIFENSLNEIEELTAELEGKTVDKKKTKRKKEGVYYTPKYITKYIVENTVGELCNQKKKELKLDEIDISIIQSSRTKQGKLNKKANDLLARLKTYSDYLLSLKILDPACGSGAFLNQALEFLIEEHQFVDEYRRHLEKDSLGLFDIKKSILENNIYGVDINEESVEIAKLSLWLRTAERGRKLSDLSNNIKCGNSLIDDPDIAGEKAFKWEYEFSEIMANGGFDVVIGNPPYVVYIKSVIGEKALNYLNSRFFFSEYNPNTYALFTNLTLDTLVCDKGYIGLIIPNSWLDGIYFSKMRKGIYEKAVFEIAYLKNLVFQEVVETVLLFVQNCEAKENSRLKLTTDILKNVFSFDAIDKEKYANRNGFNPFITSVNKLIDKLDTNYGHLKEFALVYRGLETRDNKKWLFDDKESDLFEPILLGRDVIRYNFNYSGKYVKFIKSEMKSNANESFYSRPKILMRRTGSSIIATIDTENYFALKNLYLILPYDDKIIYSMLAQLNSSLFNYYHKMKSSGENKAFAQFKGVYIDSFPFVPSLNSEFEKKVKLIINEKNKLQNTKIRFIKRLESNFNIESLSNKLKLFFEYDFHTFLSELKKKKIVLSLVQQDEWENYFDSYKSDIGSLNNEITNLEKEIDQMIFELYELTDEEIQIIETDSK